MFSNKLKIENYELESKVAHLEFLNQQLQIARDYFAKENYELRCKLYDSAVNSEMQVDFEKMNAFSIERIYDDKHPPATIIGYKHKVSELEVQIKEWNLACSQATHDRLVKEFNQYINITPKRAKDKK